MNCPKCKKYVYAIYNYCPYCGTKIPPEVIRGMVNCPVCQQRFLPQGLINHIINKAKAEVYKGEKSKHKTWLDKNYYKKNKEK